MNNLKLYLYSVLLFVSTSLGAQTEGSQVKNIDSTSVKTKGISLNNISGGGYPAGYVLKVQSGGGTLPEDGTPTLTATQVPYGSGSNLLTSEAAFNYNAATNKLSVDSILTKRIVLDGLQNGSQPSYIFINPSQATVSSNSIDLLKYNWPPGETEDVARSDRKMGFFIKAGSSVWKNTPGYHQRFTDYLWEMGAGPRGLDMPEAGDSLSSLTLNYESNYLAPGETNLAKEQTEFHLNQNYAPAFGGSLVSTRVWTASLPNSGKYPTEWDWNVDKTSWGNRQQVEKVRLDFRPGLKQLYYFDSTSINFMLNNIPAIRQRNAANTASYLIAKYDNNDVLNLSDWLGVKYSSTSASTMFNYATPVGGDFNIGDVTTPIGSLGVYSNGTLPLFIKSTASTAEFRVAFNLAAAGGSGGMSISNASYNWFNYFPDNTQSSLINVQTNNVGIGVNPSTLGRLVTSGTGNSGGSYGIAHAAYNVTGDNGIAFNASGTNGSGAGDLFAFRADMTADVVRNLVANGRATGRTVTKIQGSGGDSGAPAVCELVIAAHPGYPWSLGSKAAFKNNALLFSTSETSETTPIMVLSRTGRLNIGSNTESAVGLTISSTDAVGLPIGTTGQRPTVAQGYGRLNSTTGQFEGSRDGSTWENFKMSGNRYLATSASATIVGSGAGNKVFDGGKLFVNSLSGAVTITLSSSTYTAGDEIWIKGDNSCSATNTITITPSSGTVNGGTSVILSIPHGSVRLFFDGTDWNF